MVRWVLRALPAAILGVLMFAAGTSPHAAVSNVSKWADLFHITLPNALKGKTADIWIFWVCLIGIILYIIIMFFLGYFKEKKAKLIIEFSPQKDLKIWTVGPPYLKKQTIRKVATVHVCNTGKNDAQECEAFLEIIEKDKTTSQVFPLHWADTLYNALSTSIERITIGGLPRRLDVVFTEAGQGLEGCSIAASQALAARPRRDQFFLAQGEYKAIISVHCSNGRDVKGTFVIKSPDNWSNLIMEKI